MPPMLENGRAAQGEAIASGQDQLALCDSLPTAAIAAASPLLSPHFLLVLLVLLVAVAHLTQPKVAALMPYRPSSALDGDGQSARPRRPRFAGETALVVVGVAADSSRGPETCLLLEPPG